MRWPEVYRRRSYTSQRSIICGRLDIMFYYYYYYYHYTIIQLYNYIHIETDNYGMDSTAR